jgi:hypothetical protein
MAVPVLAAEPRFGAPRRILSGVIASLRFAGRYAPSPDGHRFLVIAPLETDLTSREMPITVVLGWQALLQDD